MQVRFFQLDSFTTHHFAGNPAAVMLLDAYPPDPILQALAAENNLAETAFLVPHGRDYQIRWFTPTVEVPLCGHATLASAAVVLGRLEPGRQSVIFHSASGPLPVRAAANRYVMDFPARPCTPTAPPPDLAAILGAPPLETLSDGCNLLVRLATPTEIRALAPNLAAIEKLPYDGLIVTAAGKAPYDCTSRYFAPAKGIPEDPVTGGAHCALTPFWSDRLGKTELHAHQASPRGGDLTCRLRANRVELEGACVFYLEGTAHW